MKEAALTVRSTPLSNDNRSSSASCATSSTATRATFPFSPNGKAYPCPRLASRGATVSGREFKRRRPLTVEVRLSFGSGPWGLGSPRYSGRSGPYAVHVLVFDLALVFGAGRSMMVPVPWRSDGRGGPLSIFDAVALGILCVDNDNDCLLYTSPSPRDLSTSRMPSSA